MKYYVTYKDVDSCEMTLVIFETENEVVNFIEEKIDSFDYGLSNFKVMCRTELFVEAKPIPIKIFMNNSS